jgi:hypothetical protein
MSGFGKLREWVGTAGAVMRHPYSPGIAEGNLFLAFPPMTRAPGHASSHVCVFSPVAERLSASAGANEWSLK